MSDPDKNFKRLQEAFAVVERIAILAVARLGGTMRITDPEWLSAQGADMQWRTVRPLVPTPELQPEIHVAVTLQGENVPISGGAPVKGGSLAGTVQ